MKLSSNCSESILQWSRQILNEYFDLPLPFSTLQGFHELSVLIPELFRIVTLLATFKKDI